jgi:hypothetical protein
LEPTTTWLTTGLVSAPQLSDWSVEPLAVRVQFPGPRRGTSTVSKPGPSVPDRSPLNALAFDIGATGLTLVVVTLEKLLATDDVVGGVFAVTITGVVRVLGAIVDVVVSGTLVGTWVVTGDVEEGGGDEATGTRGVDVAVRVKTSTRSKSGLDHIKRWALFSEKGERGIVFEG